MPTNFYQNICQKKKPFHIVCLYILYFWTLPIAAGTLIETGCWGRTNIMIVQIHQQDLILIRLIPKNLICSQPVGGAGVHSHLTLLGQCTFFTFSCIYCIFQVLILSLTITQLHICYLNFKWNVNLPINQILTLTQNLQPQTPNTDVNS